MSSKLIAILVAATTVMPALVAPGSAAEFAACNAGGTWSIQQSNGPVVEVKLIQNPDNGILSGTVTASGGVRGLVGNSRMAGRSFELRILWDGEGERIGIYNGIVDRDNKMTGTAYSATNPAHVATWTAVDKVFAGCPNG